MRQFDPVHDLREALGRASLCKGHPPLHISRSREEAALWNETFQTCAAPKRHEHLRFMATNDLFFLLIYILGLKILDTNWHFKRAAEVNERPEGALDFWCYSDDTEYLTGRGWLPFLALAPDDTFATRNPNAGFEWQRADGFNRQPYVGKLVRLHSKNLGEFLVTPNHRVLVATPSGRERIVRADHLIDNYRKYRIPVTSRWAGTPVPPQRFGALTFSGDQFCQFMGMWLADGSVRTDPSRNEIQIAKQQTSRAYHPYRELLESLGLKLNPRGGRNEGKLLFANRELAAYLRQFGGALAKSIPAVILAATPEQLTRFWRYYGLGDGNQNRTLLYTSSAQMAEQLGEVAQKMGCSASWFVDARQRAIACGDRVINSINPNYIVSLRRTAALDFRCEAVTYSGQVNCVSVPNGTLYVRRNGKAIWSGNSRGSGKSAILTLGLNIQSVLRNPNETICIFSHTRPSAKQYLRQIKTEFEHNELLKDLFPDILWRHPKREAPKWALDSETPVLTLEGWKAHGDLSAGDSVFGSRGMPIRVLGNSGPLRAECRRVVLDDCELVASSDHLWPVQQKPCSGGAWPKPPPLINLTTDELPIGTRRARLCPTPAVEFPQRELPLDPYLLGYWLGNGTAGTNLITMHRRDEDELLGHLKAVGFATYLHRRKAADNFSMYGVCGLKEQLEQLGCLTNKHLPEAYLFAHLAARRALLQGLMDSDGTCKKAAANRCAGMCMFSNTNLNLADGVFFLAASLGMRPSRIRFMPCAPGRLEVHHIYFVGIKEDAPFRLRRKLELCKEHRHKVGRYLRTIEPVASRPVNCIKVDAADGIYLAGRCLVPTHNSEDDGIVVKRQSNPKEMTIEAHGLIDGQPTGKHYDILDYDDIIPDYPSEGMIQRITEQWELSLALKARQLRFRVTGTFYDARDTYHTMMERNFGIPRIRCMITDPDCPMSSEEIVQQRQSVSPRTWALQYLLDLTAAESDIGFKRSWLRWTKELPPTATMNIYLFCDPATMGEHSVSYTAMWVLGAFSDKKLYVLDAVRDRLGLVERADKFFELVEKWRPVTQYYEQYALSGDLEYIKEQAKTKSVKLNLKRVGGISRNKDQRINDCVVWFAQHRIVFPEGGIRRRLQSGKEVDLVELFIEDEYAPYPYNSKSLDMLDAISRIADPEVNIVFPRLYGERTKPEWQEQWGLTGRGSSSWMAE